MSYPIDDDASQFRELKEKIDELQSDFLSTQFSVTQENQDSSQSTFPGANPSARGGSGGSGGGSASEPYPTTLQTPSSTSGVLTIDLNFHTHTITVTEDITSILFSNIPVAGQSRQFTILFKQDGTANTWDITFPASMGGAVISLAEDQRARYVFHTEDAGVTYEIDSLLGPRIFTTDVSNWSQFPALQDIDFSTFDGINIDRLLLDQAAGSAIAVGDTGFTSDAAKNLISHVPTGASHVIQVNGVNIVTVNATSVLAPDILPSGVDDIGSTLLPWNDVISNQLSLQAVTAPGAPNDGEIYYDSTLSKFRAREDGVTKDLISNSASGFTPVRAIISDISGDLIASSITSAELLNALTGYPVGDSVDVRLDALEASGGKLLHELITDEPVDITKLTIWDDAGDAIFNLPTGEKFRIREANTTPSIASFGDSIIDLERRTNLNGNILEGILRAEFNSNATGVAANREIYGNADGLIFNTPSTKRIEMREAGVAFLEMSNSEIIPSVDNVVNLGDNSVGTPKRFAQVNAHGGDFAGNILVSGNALFNGDVFLGSSGLDDVFLNGVVQTDILMDDEKSIKSTSGVIGFFPKDSASVGSLGSVGIPVSTTGISSASVADSRAGAFDGSMIIQDLGTGSPVLFIRQTDGNWSSVLMGRDALT